MKARAESYESQKKRWPKSGRHVLAQYDETSIIVYQAYRGSIGHAAARDDRFGGGGFRFERMSWIKPNFLWMMYRSSWGQKDGQEVVLAVRLERAGFDEILSRAVPSGFTEALYPDRASWQRAVKTSEVRLQWDPDHGPSGGRLERRAIQLGLRGEVLRKYGTAWVIELKDVSDFVADQRSRVGTEELLTPSERVYPVMDPDVARRLGLSEYPRRDP